MSMEAGLVQHIRFGVSIVLCACAAVAPSNAQEDHSYIFIGSAGNDAGSIVWLDYSSITKQGSAFQVWVLNVPKSLSPSSLNINYAMTRIQFDCAQHTLQISYGAAYGKNGEVLNSGTKYELPSPIVPGSIGESEADFVCQGKLDVPDAKAIPTIQEVIKVSRIYAAATTAD